MLDTQTSSSKKKKPPGFVKTVLRLLVILGLLAFSAWSYWNYQNATKEIERLSNPTAQQEELQKEREELKAAVSKLMILPEDEEPTVATVTDAEQLAKVQPFFKNAQNGDKVLLYVKAGKSIIYSPARNIVVNAGIIQVQGDSQQQNPLLTNPPLQVEIRQGTSETDRVNTLAEQLGQVVEVIDVTEAANQDYQGPVVVINTTDEARIVLAQYFAANLGVQPTLEMPVGEVDATADVEVVVIVGN